MSFIEQVPPKLRDEMLSKLNHGEFNLLLGAGASMDSVDSSGVPLPSGPKLRDEINQRFSLSQTTLADAYEIALEKSPSDLDTFFRQRFSGTQPAPWWPDLLQPVWKRLWTLNVDDVVEQVYANSTATHQPLIRSFHWNELSSESSGLQLIHLHGKIVPKQKLDLVFAITEYVRAIEKTHSWHRRFFDAWVSEPFIALGSSLMSEYDLAQATRASRTPGLEHSYYVSRTIDDAMREQLELRRVIPIELTAAEFAVEVEGLSREHRTTTLFQWQATPVAGPTLASFSNQFEHLRLQDTELTFEHDFYAGDEPRWQDSTSLRPATLKWHRAMFADAKRHFLNPERQAILHLAYGERFGGRSVGLFEASRMLTVAGYTGFVFKSGRRMDVGAIVQVLKAREKLFLVFDGIADFADDIQLVLEKCREQGIRCVILATENIRRRHRVSAEIDDSYVERVGTNRNPVSSPLDVEDAAALVNKLVSAGRLGQLQEKSEKDRNRHFVGREIFDAMSEVEFGAGYQSRFGEQLRRISSPAVRKLVLLSTLLNNYGFALPVQFVEAAGMKPEQLGDRETRRLLQNYLLVENGEIRTRFRAVTFNELRRQVKDSEVASLIADLLISLSPYVNKETRYERSIEYRIVKSVMRARPLSVLIGREQLSRFYERLGSYYDGDAQYWEQRAIAEELAGDLTKAVSFAGMAVSLAPQEPWRATNFGRMMLLRSTLQLDLLGPEAITLFRKGNAELARAFSLQKRSILPIVIGLSHSASFYRALIAQGPGQDKVAEVESQVKECVESVRRHPMYDDINSASVVDRIYEQFLRLYAVRERPASDRERQKVLQQPFPKVKAIENFEDTE